jgi:RNA polymerase sigma-70 factor, ECF subfamily
MEAPAPGEVTELLAEVRMGNKTAESRLISLIYAELHRIAQRCMCRERPDHTLQATALVNEACIKLLNQDIDCQNRPHLLAMAAHSMRCILVDYARARLSLKRGGACQRIDLDNAIFFSDNDIEKTLALDQALSRLAEWDPRQCRVVELRFFGGLTEEEIAEVLGVSVRTVKREWNHARAWLHAEIGK